MQIVRLKCDFQARIHLAKYLYFSPNCLEKIRHYSPAKWLDNSIGYYVASYVRFTR